MGIESNPIGIIDSGIGGLSMVVALNDLLPSENIIYIADPLHFPYGEKSKEELMIIASSLMSFLIEEKKVKAIVTACGTISSTCLEDFYRLFPVPIFGIINPATEEAVKTTQTGKIAVLATTATVKSGSFRLKIHSKNPNLIVREEAWPELVSAIENGSYLTEDWKKWVKNQFIQFETEGFDTIIMGCTHFALITSFFQSLIESSQSIVNPALATAREVRTFLERHHLLASSGRGKNNIIIRGNCQNMEKILMEYPDFHSICPESFPERFSPKPYCCLERSLTPVFHSI